MFKKIVFPLLLSVTIALTGCSAAKTALKKQDLTVESHVSNSVILEPLMPEERVVYIRVKDLSGNEMRRGMTSMLKQTLQEEGLVVTNNPKEANLMLNASIVSAKKTTKDEKDALVSSGYKGAAEGLITAAAITSVSGGSSNDLAGFGLAGAAVGFLADTMIDDTYYTFVMDVELRERPLAGDEIDNSKDSTASRGFDSKNATAKNNSNSKVKRGNNYNWIVYETRIVSVANQMNLDIKNAIPLVQEKASNTLAEFLL